MVFYMAKKPEPDTALDNPWVRQSHAISRAAYNLSAMGRRVVFVAMARVQAEKDGELKAEFSRAELMKLLGRSGGGGRDSRQVEEAVKSIQDHAVILYNEDGSGVRRVWFPDLEFTPNFESVTLRFNRFLKREILDFRDQFTTLYLSEYGRLTGRYSQRIFEIVMSYKGFAGKGGNKPGEWWCEFTVNDLREMLNVNPNEYPRTDLFRIRCVDDPVREINEKIPSVRFSIERLRKGRRLTGFRFYASVRRSGEPKPTNPAPATESEAEESKWIRANEDLYAQLLDEERNSVELAPLLDGLTDDMKEIRAQGAAFNRLKNHPEAIRPPGLRGRPKKHKEKP